MPKGGACHSYQAVWEGLTDYVPFRQRPEENEEYVSPADTHLGKERARQRNQEQQGSGLWRCVRTARRAVRVQLMSEREVRGDKGAEFKEISLHSPAGLWILLW